MPMYYDYQKYPIAEMLNKRGLSFPSFPGLENKEIEKILNLRITLNMDLDMEAQ